MVDVWTGQAWPSVAVHEEARVDGLARSMRLVTGLGMIAAGSSLAAPAGIELAAQWQAGRTATTAQPVPALGSETGAGFSEAWQPASVAPHPVAAGRAGDQPLVTPPLAVQPYLPPTAPTPLPAAPVELGAAGPDLTTHYRTTLTVPPPPLLDGQRPPPLAVGWSGRTGAGTAAFQRPLAPLPVASYRVRDGDDLTAIAIRFYGTPAAAAAIWQANRGSLQDPGLLPIGLEIVLPQPGAIGLGSGQDRSIEPPVAGPAIPPPAAPAVTASWLKRD